MLHGPTYPPPPLLHAQKCASRHNGDVSYTYTGILSCQSSVSDTILCEKKLWSGQRGGGGIAQWPPLKYATVCGSRPVVCPSVHGPYASV